MSAAYRTFKIRFLPGQACQARAHRRRTVRLPRGRVWGHQWKQQVSTAASAQLVLVRLLKPHSEINGSSLTKNQKECFGQPDSTRPNPHPEWDSPLKSTQNSQARTLSFCWLWFVPRSHHRELAYSRKPAALTAAYFMIVTFNSNKDEY